MWEGDIFMPNQNPRLAIHAITHFMIDFACIYALTIGALAHSGAAMFILLYNVLAFGLQAPLGAIADTVEDVRSITILGCGLVVWGVFFCRNPWVCIPLIGIGNALFHVGGATATLRHCPGNALRAGIYVAPGALGVALGTLVGKANSMSPIVMVVLLSICLLMVNGAGPAANLQTQIFKTKNELPSLNTMPIMICLLSIGVRAFAGFTAITPAGITYGFMIAAFAAFLGKLLGGAFVRIMPWRVAAFIFVGAGGLIMALFSGSIAVYFGLFLFNMAMPLTLSAVMTSIPQKVGLGFGLTTLALLLGSAPLYVLPKGYTPETWFFVAIILASAAMLFFVLRKPRFAIKQATSYTGDYNLPEEPPIKQDGAAFFLPEETFSLEENPLPAQPQPLNANWASDDEPALLSNHALHSYEDDNTL